MTPQQIEASKHLPPEGEAEEDVVNLARIRYNAAHPAPPSKVPHEAAPDLAFLLAIIDAQQAEGAATFKFATDSLAHAATAPRSACPDCRKVSQLPDQSFARCEFCAVWWCESCGQVLATPERPGFLLDHMPCPAAAGAPQPPAPLRAQLPGCLPLPGKAACVPG